MFHSFRKIWRLEAFSVIFLFFQSFKPWCSHKKSSSEKKSERSQIILVPYGLLDPEARQGGENPYKMKGHGLEGRRGRRAEDSFRKRSVHYSTLKHCISIMTLYKIYLNLGNLSNAQLHLSLSGVLSVSENPHLSVHLYSIGNVKTQLKACENCEIPFIFKICFFVKWRRKP